MRCQFRLVVASLFALLILSLPAFSADSELLTTRFVNGGQGAPRWPRLPEGGHIPAASPEARAYLPLVRGRQPMPTVTPTPTSTPIPGCSTIPALLSPSNGATLDTLIPEFRWDSGDNPYSTRSWLEVGADPTLSRRVAMVEFYRGQGIFQWQIESNLEPATTYYWRAHQRCGSTRGPYSEVWSFTTGSGGEILPAPVLLSPADGATLLGTTVTLCWSPVSDASRYWAHYIGGNIWWSIRMPGSETTQDLQDLLPNTTYEWWVQAWNDYAWGVEPAHWRFTTGPSESSASFDAPRRSLSAPQHRVLREGAGETVMFEEQDAR